MRAVGLGLLFTLSACAAPESSLSREQPLALRSTILSADGKTLATVFEENRVAVPASQIPQVVRDATVAVEDARFFHHGGVDTRAILRALVSNVNEGRVEQGGSTITQQLAKMMFTAPNAQRDVKTKIVESRLALALEQRYSKDEILAMYLNRAYFGARAYGVAAAAETYFNKPLAKLTLSEAALLAGMVKAPTTLDPFENAAGAKQRRDYVLDRMRQERMITDDQAARAIAEPLKLRRRSTYRPMRFPHFVEYIERSVLRDPAFGKTEEERAQRLYRGGLTIKTTINSEWQRYAEEAVRAVLPDDDDPEAALIAIDPRTGAIRAMVGGRNWHKRKFNLASQGGQQPGSAFKPFVLGAALEQGITPSARYNSNPGTLRYGPNRAYRWRVNNYDGRGRGVVSLRTGMQHSINGVYARLILDVGEDEAADFAKRAGIESQMTLDECDCVVPSLALGTMPVTPLEMASAYATFAANGVYRRPHGVATAKDDRGQVVFDETKNIKPEQRISPAVAYTITDVLQTVACCGTARRTQFGRPVAAKTGTTEERKDVWLVGYTPELVTAVWVGYDPVARPMRFVNGIEVFGGTVGAMIWRGFMERALEGAPLTDFEQPEGELPFPVQRDCSLPDGSGGTRCFREERRQPRADDGGDDPSPAPTPTSTGSGSPSPAPPSPTPTPKPSGSPKPHPTTTKEPKPTESPTP